MFYTMFPQCLCDLFPGFAIQDCQASEDALVITACSQADAAACSCCGHLSQRRHSCYTRHPQDMPWCGRMLHLHLIVFRFFCDNPRCPRKTFCQQQPCFLAPHAQSTQRLKKAIQSIGLTAGGEPGCRLGHKLGIRRSADTFLRYLRQLSLKPTEVPRIIGIDDWAWCKGHRYGTVICDLERARVIDLLPDREKETVVDWLKQHPSIQVVSRDRATGYQEAILSGAPQAVQIADRWHLLHNLSQHVHQVLNGYRKTLKQIQPEMPPSEPIPNQVVIITKTALDDGVDPDELLAWLADPQVPPGLRRRWRHTLAHHWRQQGVPMCQIVERLGVSRATVYRYLSVAQLPVAVWQPPPKTAHRMTVREKRREEVMQLRQAGVPVAELVHRVGISRASVYRILSDAGQPNRQDRTYFPGTCTRSWRHRFKALWQAGQHDLQALWETLRAEGYRMAFDSVRRAVYRSHAHVPLATLSAKQYPFHYPGRATWLFVLDPTTLKADAYRFLLEVLYAEANLLQLYVLAQGFRRLITTHRHQALLDHWLHQAEASPFPEFQRFANGLRQDEEAVRAALKHAWSNGPVEGQILRLKLIRRQMFGRGSLDLLKRRVMPPDT
jgi:transposase